MKKTVSILTALLLAVSPAAQRAYAQEATVQVQQNVEESKASKVWSTVKEYAGKAANAVAENKGKILGVAGTALLLGAGYNGVTLSESIKTIWAFEGITMAQKVQLIAKVIFLRKEITTADLENLKKHNTIDDSNKTVERNEAVAEEADKELKELEQKQKDLDARRKSLETKKKDAEVKKESACEECNANEKDLGKDNLCAKSCKPVQQSNGTDTNAEAPKNNGNGTDTTVGKTNNTVNGTDTE